MSDACWCYECDRAAERLTIFGMRSRMNLCPDCGNKRCPRSTDHRHACTGSNEPGQDGSIYGTHEHASERNGWLL